MQTEYRIAETDREMRAIPRQYAECRLESREGQPDRITGYASVFYNSADQGTEFELGKNLRERIMPGAFDKCLAEGHDVMGLYNHDCNYVLGRSHAGTMRLSVDQRGLKFDIDPPNTTYCRDLKESLRRGDVPGSSFSFLATREDYSNEGRMQVRNVRECRIFDVGPVASPAYKSTTAVVAKRSMDNFAAMEHRDIEFHGGDATVLVGDMVQWWVETVMPSGMIECKPTFGEVHRIVEDGIAKVPGGQMGMPGTKEDPALVVRAFADMHSGDPDMLQVQDTLIIIKCSLVRKVNGANAVQMMTGESEKLSAEHGGESREDEVIKRLRERQLALTGGK